MAESLTGEILVESHFDVDEVINISWRNVNFINGRIDLISPDGLVVSTWDVNYPLATISNAIPWNVIEGRWKVELKYNTRVIDKKSFVVGDAPKTENEFVFIIALVLLFLYLIAKK